MFKNLTININLTPIAQRIGYVMLTITVLNLLMLCYNLSFVGIHQQTSAENLITIILTALAVILAIFTIGVAILSFYGYKTLMKFIEKSVAKETREYTEKYLEKYLPGTSLEKDWFDQDNDEGETK